MENFCNIIVLAFSCLVYSHTIQGSTTELNAVSGTGTGDTTRNSTGDENTWYCPEGWIVYSSGIETSCLWIGEKTSTFAAALAKCQSFGGSLVTFFNSHKETFVKDLSHKGKTAEHWIGLHKPLGYDVRFQYQTKDGVYVATPEVLPQQMRDYISYKAQCAYIPSFGDDLEIDDCESEYLAICETDMFCKPGYFGRKCEKECHCEGEPCNSKPKNSSEVTCNWGCKKNWIGVACDIEKKNPEVKYYCIHSPAELGKFAYIRIYTKGVQYSSIYGLTANKSRGKLCALFSDNTSGYAQGTITIKIPVNDSIIQEMSEGKCIGQRLSENVFTWNIVMKENDGILLEHDVLINITCDFSVADNLVRADQYLITGKSLHVQQETLSPESIQNDVVLQVVNAYSGEPVKEASIGSTVVLQMKYGLQKGSLVKSISPYSCFATSADGKNVKQLLNENGCQSPDSPLQPFKSVDKKVVTPWFNLFAFEDEQTVIFKCSFVFCLTENCKVGCWKSPRSKRETQDQKDEEKLSATRSIRVLPSIPAQKPISENHHTGYQQGPAPGYEIGPFVYLNPVTCTLFLLILLIFMCMYIAFLRTLRKSVYDIRKEIEVKRSRDKFLHCGCVQQKDRDYIAP